LHGLRTRSGSVVATVNAALIAEFAVSWDRRYVPAVRTKGQPVESV